tara:strand:+ start:120 stop:455 length:336 start_codon:yes stop_codon:yes gene_type:complete
MTQVVNLKSNGIVEISFSSGKGMNFGYDDSLLPASVTAHLNSLWSYLTSEGLSEVHMEQDTFRTFTHKVLAGLVGHEDGISRPEFAALLGLESEIKLAFTPVIEELPVTTE